MTVGVYGPAGLSYPGGAPAALVPVTVCLPGTTTPAVLYTDETGTAVRSAPLTTDGLANLVFFAAPGAYDLLVNGGVLRVYADVVAAGSGGGGGAYTHVQVTPAASWTVNHNLGYRPWAWVANPDGSVALADVIHNSVNQLTAVFPTATAGKLEMS